MGGGAAAPDDDAAWLGIAQPRPLNAIDEIYQPKFINQMPPPQITTIATSFATLELGTVKDEVFELLRRIWAGLGG